MNENKDSCIYLSATLNVSGGITATLSEDMSLNGTLNRDGNITYYSDDYTITPSTSVQTLASQGKYMNEDVVVLEIPYHETTNPSGGYTVIIG